MNIPAATKPFIISTDPPTKSSKNMSIPIATKTTIEEELAAAESAVAMLTKELNRRKDAFSVVEGISPLTRQFCVFFSVFAISSPEETLNGGLHIRFDRPNAYKL